MATKPSWGICSVIRRGDHMLGKTARRAPARFAAILPITLVVGCGSELAEVHGTVSLDGQKISAAPDLRGTVLFSPAEPGSAAGSGMLNESGEYTVCVGATEGLRPGPYQVAISVTKILPPNTPGGTPSGQRITPPAYASPKTSGLHANVAPGSNTFDFALTSRHGQRNQSQ